MSLDASALHCGLMRLGNLCPSGCVAYRAQVHRGFKGSHVLGSPESNGSLMEMACFSERATEDTVSSPWLVRSVHRQQAATRLPSAY